MQNEENVDEENEPVSDDAVGAVIGRPPEAEASDEATEDEESESEMQNAECKMLNEKTEDAESV